MAYEKEEDMLEVGRFTLVGDRLTGPADYFADRGGVDAAVEKVLRSVTFDYAVRTGASGSPERALLVALQTDYAEWHGTRTFAGRLNRSAAWVRS